MHIMRYPAITLNENGKALVCPHCDNEELTPGDFCIICGNDIINHCAVSPDRNVPSVSLKSCGAILVGNARYCSHCGNESSFYQKGWLADWRSENIKKAIRNASTGGVVDIADLKKTNNS